MKEIDESETEIKRKLELKIEKNRLFYQFISYLNKERGSKMKKIKKIETKMEKLQIPQKIIDTIKKSLLTEIVSEYYNIHKL